MSAADVAVATAVRMLPRGLRARYREQWAADLRDADEAGVPRRSIAAGALLTAVTADRPLPSVRWPGAAERSRLALAFAAVSAVIALSQWSGLGSSGTVTDNRVGDFLLFLVGMFLGITALVAPVVAVGLAASWGVPARTRVSVALLVLASAAPLLPTVARDLLFPTMSWRDPGAWFAPADAVFPLAGGLMIAVVIMNRPWAALRRDSPARARAVVAGAGICAIGLLTVAAGAIAWTGREPLVYGYPDSPDYQAVLDEWVALKVQFETRVDVTFVALSLAFVALAVVVAMAVRRASARQAVLLVATAVAGVLVAYAALSDFLHLGAESVVPAISTEPVLAFARLALALCVFVGAGGIRLSSRSAAGEHVVHDARG